MQKARDVIEQALSEAEVEQKRQESGLAGEGSIEFWERCIREFQRMLFEIDAGRASGASSGMGRAAVDELSPTNPTTELITSAEQAYLSEAKRLGKL